MSAVPNDYIHRGELIPLLLAILSCLFLCWSPSHLQNMRLPVCCCVQFELRGALRIPPPPPQPCCQSFPWPGGCLSAPPSVAPDLPALVQSYFGAHFIEGKWYSTIICFLALSPRIRTWRVAYNVLMVFTAGFCWLVFHCVMRHWSVHRKCIWVVSVLGC